MQNNDDNEQEIIEAPKHIDRKRKRQNEHLIISFGLLLIVGVCLCFMVPYLKELATHHYDSTPLILLSVFVMPFFWLLCGWTLIELCDLLGIVEIKHSKLSNRIFITALALVLLYLAIMLPFIIETVNIMIIEFKFRKNPDAFSNGLSFSSQLPVLLQRIERYLFSIKNQSVIFTILGVVLRLCMPEKKHR